MWWQVWKEAAAAGFVGKGHAPLLLQYARPCADVAERCQVAFEKARQLDPLCRQVELRVSRVGGVGMRVSRVAAPALFSSALASLLASCLLL